MKNNILFFTSLIFITNSLVALYKEEYIYSILFYLLTITSLLQHSIGNLHTNILDKIIIGMVVSYGGYKLYCKMDNSHTLTLFIIITFLFCIYVYCYGYLTTKYCFDKNPTIQSTSHSLLHFVGSVGHHAIILL